LKVSCGHTDRPEWTLYSCDCRLYMRE